MEQRRNARAGETGDRRENPPASGIVRHDSHTRKPGSDPGSPRWEATPLRRVPPVPTRTPLCPFAASQRNFSLSLWRALPLACWFSRSTAVSFHTCIPAMFHIRLVPPSLTLDWTSQAADFAATEALRLWREMCLGAPASSRPEHAKYGAPRSLPAVASNAWNTEEKPCPLCGWQALITVQRLTFPPRRLPQSAALVPLHLTLAHSASLSRRRRMWDECTIHAGPALNLPTFRQVTAGIPVVTQECDESTARQFRTLRLAAIAHLMRVPVSLLSFPRLRPRSAGELSRQAGTLKLFVCLFHCAQSMRVIDVRMEQRRNERAVEMGDPRENPPTNGIVRHDYHI
ncbi:hypothetical protein PR048_020597 [Dryococelus australis]|uniref:Uncharacterized protein n=1 Tax=Dryococelus australis TaxID=614101 RepID=A0ABQ9H6P7_9NEOP|nr:hypothetical protein PR048_020597 [Dryococelus australis]